MIDRVESKQHNYLLYFKGHYGNRLRIWENLDALLPEIKITGEAVCLRTTSTPGLKLPNYCVPLTFDEVNRTVDLWVKEHKVVRSEITANESGEHDKIVLQGEVTRDEHWMSLTYSREPLKMRDAFAKKHNCVKGLQAKMIIEAALDAPSLDNLYRLFEEFPEAIIEFSSYSKPVGNLQLNTVFWEVRNY